MLHELILRIWIDKRICVTIGIELIISNSTVWEYIA